MTLLIDLLIVHKWGREKLMDPSSWLQNTRAKDFELKSNLLTALIHFYLLWKNLSDMTLMLLLQLFQRKDGE